MDELKVRNSFLTVAGCYPKLRHGKYIPLTYWVIKVNKKLLAQGLQRITPRKLLRSLEKLGLINRELEADEMGDICKICATERRITRISGANPTRVGFLCVATAGTPEETLPLNQHELGKLFQARYVQYQHRKSILILPPIDTGEVTAVRDAVPPPRVVTPTEHMHEILKDKNKEIYDPLSSVIKPDKLVAMLKEDIDLDSFKNKVQDIGCRMRAEANTKHFSMLAKDRYDDRVRVSDKNKYTAFLNRFCCPLSKKAIQGFMLLALKIDEESKATGMMQLQKYGGNGYGQRLVAVVPADTGANLKQTARRWLPQLFEAIRGNENLSQYEIAFHLLKLHRSLHKQAFDDVVKTSMATTFKMNPYRQIAMFHKTNLTYEQGRGMRPYFNADKCNPLNSERTIRKLEVHPNIRPTFTSFLELGTKRNAWCLPCNDVVQAQLARDAGVSSDAVHILLSADHGQGAFRCNLAILKVGKSKVVKEYNVLVGQIDCKKDTTKVLEDSGVVASINRDLLQLKNTNPTVQIFASGDLAWYSMALGKESMSGEHCYRCKIRWKEFQGNPRATGRPWTLSLMKEQLDKLNSGELDRSDKDLERGLKTAPLIDCIESKDWLFPPLHGLDLLVNTPFDYFNRWVWYRLEKIPIELITARKERALQALYVDKLWQDIVDSEEHCVHMEYELGLIVDGGEDEEFEDENHQQEYTLQEQVLVTAEIEVARAKERHENETKKLKSITAAVNKMEKQKTYGKTNQGLWLQLQRLLRQDFNIYASTYHGGDMEGNECRKLMKNAVPVMNALESLFLGYLEGLPPADLAGRADVQEVKLFVSAFKRLFQYMDLLSHFCYQPAGSMTNEDVAIAEDVWVLATNLWSNLMPTIPMKVHCWTHLIEDLRRLRGLKFHNDHGIEREHQRGVKNNKRVACIRDFEKKTSNIMRHTATGSAPEVISMEKDTVSKKRKRHPTSIPDYSKDRILYLYSVPKLAPITANIPSMLELIKNAAADR